MRQAKLLDGASSFNHMLVDVHIVDGTITNIAKTITPPRATHTIEADGLYLAPALIDLYATTHTYSESHAHLCAPDALTLASERPVTLVERHYYGNIHQFETLPADFANRYIALSNCHTAMTNTSELLHIMEYAASIEMPLFLNALDPHLSKGDMLAHPVTWQQGHRLIDADFEIFDLSRLVMLQKKSNCKLHISQVATKDAVQQIADLKHIGYPITADVAITNLLCSLDELEQLNAFHKMWPPLGSDEDKVALCDAVSSGVIDVVVSNHTPVTYEQKDAVVADAAFGTVTLPYMLHLLAHLSHSCAIPLEEVLSWHSTKAARLLGVDHGLAVGQPASCIIFAEPTPTEPLILPFTQQCPPDTIHTRIHGHHVIDYTKTRS